jgi:3-mercaptopyruvate sulfurtransferase SseA
MDGGRALWEKEGRPLVTEKQSYPAGNITIGVAERPEDPRRSATKSWPM